MGPRFALFATLACIAVARSAFALAPDPLGPDRPWLIFHAPQADGGDSLAYADRIVSAWKALPDRLRPYSAFELHSPNTSTDMWPDRFHDLLQELQFAEVPLVITVANSNPKSFYSVDALRDLFDAYTTIRGVHVSGLSFGEYPVFGDVDPIATPPQAEWLTQVIDLGAEYGRRILIELDGLEWPRLMANTWTQRLYDAFTQHPEIVVPMNSQRGANSVVASSALMGLWLEGAADQWGLDCDSAWYTGSDFIEPGEFGHDPDALMPPALYRAMVLNGAMTGATVYRFPASADLWFGPRRHYWDEALFPILTETLDSGYIARKDLVQDKIHVAYRLNPAASATEFDRNLKDLDPVFHEGHMMHGAYGLELPGQVPELVLNTGAFYWIPILSPHASDTALAHFDEVILPGALLDAQSWRERLSTYYTRDGQGSAFISRVGRGIFVMQTRENFYEEQSFSIPDAPAPVHRVSVQRHPEGVELSWPFREGDVFYRVYRRELPATEWEKISGDLDVRSYLDTTANSRDKTVAYAVTALTNETEPYQGTVNYGDYLVVNAVESRIAEQVVLDPDTSAATSAPIPPPVDARPASQPWWPNVEGLSGDELFAARAIAAQIESLELAFTNEDLNGVVGLYAPDYADSAGWGREYVRAAYQEFFNLYRAGRLHRQIRGWDFAAFTTEGKVGTTLYLRLSGQTDPRAAGPGGLDTVMMPNTPAGEVQCTFVKSGDAWLLAATNPPLPNFDDFLPLGGASLTEAVTSGPPPTPPEPAPSAGEPPATASTE